MASPENGAGGFQSRQRLIAENERLRAVCVRAEETASRYAIMLREGDHRIKNSLQVVASLLQMQQRREENPGAREALANAVARIRSIAAIHEALQVGEGADRVDLGRTLQTMCRGLQEMAGETRSVAILVSVEPIETSIAFAQPLTLAVNELVINALRHAFPGNRTGTIRVCVSQAQAKLRIVVADDGAGMSTSNLEGGGYGVSLVRAMMEQIGGVIDIATDAGTKFTLTAPVPASTI